MRWIAGYVVPGGGFGDVGNSDQKVSVEEVEEVEEVELAGCENEGGGTICVRILAQSCR
jgi:hypothetical protein